MSLRTLASASRPFLLRSFKNSLRPQQPKIISNMLYRNYTSALPASIPGLGPPDMSRGPLYRYDTALPKLPVPTLEETCARYLKSVRPLLNDQEFEATSAAVAEFQMPGGMGEELQRRLLAKANDPKTVNWLEDWWNDLAYFGYRDPVVIYVSYFYAYRDDLLRKKNTSRAAAIIQAAMDFRRQVVDESLAPEMAKKSPLDSSTYKYMFNACRYPAKPSDFELAFDPAKNNHVAVVRKNQFFVFDLIKDGKMLSTVDIEAQLDDIIKMAGDRADPAIGALTSDNRDIWTETRKALINAGSNNEELLRKIESSVFLLCLDDTSPVTRDEVSRACWHGDGRNRFFDKALQFIVFENGKAGFMGEHSTMDGTPTCRLNDYVCTTLAQNKINHGAATVSSSLAKPEKLRFALNTGVMKAIETSEKNFEELIGKHGLHVQRYEGYGKGLIKKFKCSPDAYVQMIIQLAYFKMHGVSRPTYESAQVRKFQHGRTETCRTVSTESVAWVKSMEDSHATTEQKTALFKKALDSHVSYMANAVEGKGCDRHLLGLRLSLKSHETKPDMFTQEVFGRSSHWNLSTSQLSCEHFDGYGWGEVVPDGYGIAYMVNENNVSFNVAALKEMRPDRLHHYLKEAATEMKTLFEKTLIQAPQAKL
ncbi:Carnitine O-acetyltransferase mitochondrial [Lunasporangiospora selenospora]|uniref:Carnitine O-acetyltransferase, mitochondrial n=1 Tax=Lunasporangiospora selenospora TaxID=979761 RepID=A0A9P6KFC8_9FUNG|nr:Carnitine O-acetyltransferase mitochondrial [Lunasporangiospora selenospora]